MRDGRTGSASRADLDVSPSAAWPRALNVAEWLRLLRPIESPVLEVGHVADRLARWSAQQTLTGEALNLPELHACTEGELRAVLSAPSISRNGDRSAPLWARELQSIQVASVEQEHREPLVSEPEFLALVDGPIGAAKEQLTSRAEATLERHPSAPFDPKTVSQVLISSLARRLELLVGPCAVLEMHAARMEGNLVGRTARERYDEYLELFHDPVIRMRFLQEYPVLARLVMTSLRNWVDASGEFLKRLAHDWSRIQRTFGRGKPDTLISFEALGDPHCGGRRVAACEFESGFRVMYKPRHVLPEVFFQDFLRWMNERLDYSLRPLTVIDRGEYGWVEFVEAGRCGSIDELHRFYRRQGAYVAILYLLAARDFHYENVVAAGDQPIMVDLEAIVQPTIAPERDDFAAAEQVAAELGSESVLRVGLLPSRILARDDHEGLDLSGLGAVPDQITPLRLPRWADEGTDQMRLILAEASLGAINSNPIPPGIDAAVGDFTHEVVAGFRDAYDVFCCHRESLLSADGPLASLSDVEIRSILMPTVAYSMILRSSFHPHFLSDGLSLESHFDRLLGASSVTQGPHIPEVRTAERHDLWQLDIPRFTTRSNSRDLWTSSGLRIRDYLPETGFDAVRRRLGRLSVEERDLQSWMIGTSIATNSIPSVHAHLQHASPFGRPRVSIAGGRLSTAMEIGDRLVRLAITKEDTAMWIGLASERRERWHISPVGPGLYEGLGGIALFLAALGSIADERRYIHLARAALKTVRIQIARGAFGESVAGFTGLGGHVYVLCRLAVLFEDTTLLDEADATVRTIAEFVEDDAGLDVLSGSAGCIGALLALHRTRPKDGILDVALRCGDKLLASAVATPNGLGWVLSGISSRPLGGFAHGAAGMAWALFELAAATGEQRFSEAAVEAIRYDRSLFSDTAQNWLDVREDIPDGGVGVRCLAHWCHGSAGIGLSRIRCLHHWEDDLVREEIETAVEATIAQGFGSSHSLCHGDFGNLELLVDAQQLFPGRWEAEVARLSSAALSSLEDRGCISGHVLGIESPGLMMGIAGIGYGLLRLEAPDRVPSVLLLDPPV